VGADLGLDGHGLRIVESGAERTLAVDTVVVCAGQEPRRDLVDGLRARDITPHLIGGADVAAELDAKRAIRPRSTTTWSGTSPRS
jgi:2,4-dienoyl-CoA reductase (NADPH2)